MENLFEAIGLSQHVLILEAGECFQGQIPHHHHAVALVLMGKGTITVEGTTVPAIPGEPVKLEQGSDYSFRACEKGLALLITEMNSPSRMGM